MASKSDLLAAQNFSRRRLLTAFVSGAPGGKELEPLKPLRAVFVGVGLSIIVLLVGLFMGFFQKGLSAGWENGNIIIDKSTGSRYVTKEGVLHPVLNIASARLLLPDANKADKPMQVSSSELAGLPLGSTLGIAGAPDTLPGPKQLVNTGWTACVTGDGKVDTRISTKPIARAASGRDAATVVTSQGVTWIISGQRRFQVPANKTDDVLRVVNLAGVQAREVAPEWLNLFMPGTEMGPIEISDVGKQVPGTSLLVGDVVRSKDAPSDTSSLVMPDGSLATLDSLTKGLYQLGSSYHAARDYELSFADIKGVPNSNQQWHATDWPRGSFTPVAQTDSLCALSSMEGDAATTVLATTPSSTKLKAGTSVDPSVGALVKVAGRGAGAVDMLTLVDATATKFAIPNGAGDAAKKLGYSAGDAGAANSAWMALFKAGPELTQDAAGATSAG